MQWQQYVSLSLSALAIMAVIGNFYVTGFKIDLMWKEYSRRHGLDGSDMSSIYASGTERGAKVMEKMQGRK